jgi:hypothetical protein
MTNVSSMSETVHLEREIAEVCGQLNVAHARLVALVARALDTGAWEGSGILSPEHWLAWQTGLSPTRARQIVATARRTEELPVTFEAFANGELAIDQVAVLARNIPADHDAEACALAAASTVSQLSRATRHLRAAPEPEPVAPYAEPQEVNRVHMGDNDDGQFTLNATLEADAGEIVRKALTEAHDRLFHERPGTVSWADALVDVCLRSLGALSTPSRRDRFRTYVHVDGDRTWINGGAALPAHIAEKLRCDAVIQPVWFEQGTPVSVGRSMYAVPERTRRLILDRDRVCRFPGCTATLNLEIHHLVPYPKGGTDTWNLGALCPRHHDLHHRGDFTITGNADESGGLEFRRRDGSIISPCGRPIPPTAPVPDPPPGHRYRHPTGEALDYGLLHFGTGPGSTSPPAHHIPVAS